MNESAIRQKVKSIIANLVNKCTCKINMNNQLISYSITGGTYISLLEKCKLIFPKFNPMKPETSEYKSFETGNSIVADIINYYKE